MFTSRLATEDDIPDLRALMREAIDRLQSSFLTPEQVAASHATMGLDTQLVADRTYFVVLAADARIAGCGGWSRRRTLYGGDHSARQRDPSLLYPARDPARIRAMYTRPEFARRGVGRRVIDLCERAAQAAGFRRAELMATLAGEPLYRACGYRELERVIDVKAGVPVPLVRMGKDFGG